jgi:signal transduction histidine kinase/CheY-like chemotaxis protein
VGRYNGAAHQTRQTIIAASTLLILLGLLFMITTISNVRQRAKIISELEAAKGDSEKAATLKDQFVSNMSHEIRTPLNSIIGFTNLLNATRLNTEQYDFVDTIKNASENLLRIVNDILDFSKIQAGMMQGHQHPFSISEQIKIIEKLFEQSNNKSNLRISYFIDTIMPEICIGDALRLNQILVNLVSNAIKFTHHGEIAIAVLVTKISADNVTLEFSVSDTGIGIPSERISKIFDRFEQINSASNRKTGGTGLGLSITKSLIELEGGSISVTSTENKGSAFIFTLSYALPVADTAPLRYDDGAGQNQKIFLPLQGRVLIVEDNPLNQKLIGLLLKKWQVEYELAQNGLEACEKLSHKTYSLILMDIQMPEMDGYAATAIIREKMNISTPIVALTAYSIDHDKVDFLKYGMNAYVTKPFREADLYNALTKYLDTKENNPDRQTISDESKDFSQSKLQEIENMYNGDRAYVREMAEMFVSQITVEIQNLDAAYIAKDYKNMAAIAHSMKSTVSYMGLNMDLYETLSRLEQSSGISSSEAITADINHIKMISRRTIMLIETELPSYIA